MTAFAALSTPSFVIPSFEELYAGLCDARERLRGQANVTPVVSSRALNEHVGAEVFFKCENFQRVGAFKFRGAYNAISQLSDAEKAAGLIAYSSGNHAQGVALVGRLLGIDTTIVMPEHAPAVKRAATEGYGANVVAYDPEQITREELAAQMQAERPRTLIPPYDHLHIAQGQGTAAAELIDEVGALDALIVPCGGGGLLSGSAIAARGMLSPKCRVIGIEPELADDATRSFRTGELHSVKNPPTIADGVRTPSLGKITFPLVREYVSDMRTVSEQQIKEAARYLFFHLKLVVEPAGALGLAALLSGAVKESGRVGIIISGGNVDASLMSEILSGTS